MTDRSLTDKSCMLYVTQQGPRPGPTPRLDVTLSAPWIPRVRRPSSYVRSIVYIQIENDTCPYIILVNAEHYGRAGANPRVWDILSPSFKKTQPYIYTSHCTIYHRISNIRKTHCSIGITKYEYLHNYNYASD